MGVNKVEYNGETLVDLTNDTVTEDTLAEGTTAHDASGEPIVGRMRSGGANIMLGNLKGSTWLLNEEISFDGTLIDFSLDFTSNGTDFERLYIKEGLSEPAGTPRYLMYSDYESELEIYAFLRQAWWQEEYRLVAIKGGVDATNPEAVEWFNTHGKLMSVDISNLATVDKVTNFNFASGDCSSVSINEAGTGIEWTNDEVEIELAPDNYGNIDYHYAQTRERIPIVAGNNIEFELDEENQVVKINATGGGSAPSDDSIVGTWVFNWTLNLLDIALNSFEFAFKVTEQGTTYAFNEFAIDETYVNFYGEDYAIDEAYTDGLGWREETYRTIEILEEPTDEVFISWLKANATKQGGSSSGSNFEMPQIRFSTATGSTENETPMLYVDADNPLKLTVEIVGGGALQVGDQLQVCIRKRFNGCHGNDYRRKYKLQRFAEYVVTEYDLDKKYLTVQVLFDEPIGKAFRGLFRDGMAKGLAPLYLRIRRPKGIMQSNGSGQTVDAEFSNIVTIWKHSIRGTQSIRIQ